jgi:methyl-accepting chemotaxis protein
MGTLSSTRSRIQQNQEGSQMTEEHNDTTTVKVSMRDIYQEVQRQGKLLEQIASSLPTQESKVEDHENRIRKLEQRMWQVIGIFGFLAAIVSPLVAVMTR